MARLSTEMHPLLTQQVLDLLFAKSIYSVTKFIETDTKQLSNIMRFALKDVLTVKNYIINKNAGVVRKGLDYYEELLKNSALISTGIKSLDTFLKGGFMTGKIYEICGPPSSGKTQFCLTLCKNISSSLQQHVFYLDTKRDFSAKRLKKMLNGKTEKETAEIFSKILIKHITTKHELINCLYKIKDEIKSAQLKCRLIIIDSLPPLFTNTDEYNVENNIFLSQTVSIMYYLAMECYMTFLVVNLLTSWTEGGFEMRETHENVACGKYWNGVPHNRLKMGRVDGEKCRISWLKSCQFSLVGSCDVVISDEGVT